MPRHLHLPAVLVALLLAMSAACFDVDLAGYRCDDEHACLDDFSCVAGRCVAAGSGGEGEGEGPGEGEGEQTGEGEGEGEQAGEGEGEGEQAGEGEGEGEGEPCGNGAIDAGEACDDAAANSDVTPNACRLDCQLPICGDSVTDPAFLESCDDGNVDDTDGCTSQCVSILCGNGGLDGDEQCDNGPANSDVLPDACRRNCALAFCGDNVDDSDEACDDGDIENGDGCDDNCTPTGCANGVVTAGENCDDGNVIDGDGCDRDCTLTACGNGIVTTTPVVEECDNGPLNSDVVADACRADCRRAFCGDGVTDPGNNEGCDDGNGVDDDDCGNDCVVRFCGDDILNVVDEECDDGPLNSDVAVDACRTSCAAASCGDAVTDTGETCDDDNTTSGDGCDENCTPTGCGNGITTAGEACDDANGNNGDACIDGCRLASCGDAFVFVGVEGCDNGAANSDVTADACRSDCQPARCGDVAIDSGETCDDGNTASGDGCSPACATVAPVCGDGFVDSGEGCDDGNGVGADGCTACVIDGGRACFGEPSVCCISGNVRRVPSQHATIAAAVAAASARDCIFVSAGTYDTGAATVANLDDDVTIVGEGAAVTTLRSSNGAQTLQVSGNNNDTVVQGFTIIATGGNAVVFTGNNSTITLRRNVIGPAALVGISTTGSNHTATLLQNIVRGCAGGGVDINTGSPWVFENNVVIDNGSAGSAFGGVDLTTGGSFRHNTVTANRAGNGVGAVRCAAAVTVFGSIVFGNATAPFSGLCTGSQSDFEGGTGTNIALDPLFARSGDFHLGVASPCLDRIAASTTTRDVDGDPRPQGGGFDIGADERR